MDKINLNEVYLNYFPEDDSNEIYFEPISLTGLDEMHKYSVKEEFYEFFEFNAFKSKAETKQYLRKLINRTKSIDDDIQAMYWFVRSIANNTLIGTATLVNINKGRESAEIGYGIDPNHWGKGYILKLQNALIKYAFESLKLNRLHGITMVNNERTISSILAAGFLKEGILRDYYHKQGKFIDGFKYSMLKTDYFLSIKKESCNKEISISDLINLVKDELKEDIDENSSMLNTSNWDSLSHLGIIINLSNQFKIELNPIEIADATSIKDLYRICNNLS
jgi:[ribosomal protein S5]-alanine N-acetyltransferase